MGNTKKNYYATPASKREFIRSLYPVAVEASNKLKDKDTMLSPIVILGMCAVESSWGENSTGNMYFEKRVDRNTPPTMKQLLVRRRLHNSPDHKIYTRTIKILPLEDGQYKYIVKEWYKKYDSPLDNFLEHFRGIISNPDYAGAVALGASSRLFVEKLAKAGYTYNKRYEPEKDYATKVIFAMQVINRNIDIATSPPVSYPRTPAESYPSSLT